MDVHHAGVEEMPVSKMRRGVHLAAAFVLFALLFIVFTIYSTLGTSGYSVRRLRPAARLKSRQELQEERAVDIDILDGVGVKFLSNFKNPCWYDRQGALTKAQNLYSSWLKPASAAELANYQSHRKQGYTLRCLPYFFLVGQPKCATTDVFQRINIHPDVAEALIKGPHWWSRRRYGQPYSPRPVTFLEYLDLFSGAAAAIEARWTNSTSSNLPYHEKITGDGSTSTLWDSSPTMTYLYSTLNKISGEKLFQLFFAKRDGLGHQQKNLRVKSLTSENNENQITDPEGCCFSRQNSRRDYTDYERTLYSQVYSIQPGVVLPITTADVIHSVLPKSRIIAVIREPVSRLFSSYVFFTKKQKMSPEVFDQAVQSSIQKWKLCTDHYSERTCAYNKTLHAELEVRLYNGMYNIFLRDWLNVFPQEQVMVLRMEDYHQDTSATMASIYAHLGLRGLTEEEEELVNMAPVQNKNKKKLYIGKMLNTTAETLRRFYEDFNNDLAELMGDRKFTWQDYYTD